MRELVRAIYTHVDTVDLEVTSNLNVADDTQSQQPPIKDIPSQQANKATELPSTDPVV